jgi:glycine dehydrogenase
MNLFELQDNEFKQRHIGPGQSDEQKMLDTIGETSLDNLIDKTVSGFHSYGSSLEFARRHERIRIPEAYKRDFFAKPVIQKLPGQGYYDTIIPAVILRNVFENPGWYTQYTPYQAEISQGRLESLLNFQTIVSDLTGLPVANASLLDEATAAAEAMTMFFNALNRDHDHIARPKFFADNQTFPQTKTCCLPGQNLLASK